MVTAPRATPRWPINKHLAYGTALSLFWRTFFLLVLLLLINIIAWTQTLLQMQSELQVLRSARQVASIVNLSRTAMMHSDAITRASLLKSMRDTEGLSIRLREPSDVFEPLSQSSRFADHARNGEPSDVFEPLPQGSDSHLNYHIVEELKSRLGQDTIVAGSVNQVPGLWVGFSINQENYWLQARLNRFSFTNPSAEIWTVWLLTALALSLTGAAGIARLLNSPLKDLLHAVKRVREGDFSTVTLNENAGTSEVRAVNVGFNRMTRKLAQVEQDRKVMLAGISHDLRTPLARLRLEAEMSVPDDHSRAAMIEDIEQLDAVIDKFLDYARPGDIKLGRCRSTTWCKNCLEPLRRRNDLEFNVALEDDLMVQADPVELHRALENLLENASRYGKSEGTNMAQIDISAHYQNNTVVLRLNDHGRGVPTEQLKQLTTPFFRGDAARSAAKSAGLGLTIVEQAIARMGGTFSLSNSKNAGLCANIVLRRATPA